MIRLVLSYTKSHIYDIHSALAGTLALMVMFAIKVPIKQWVEKKVNDKAEKNAKWERSKSFYLKICNGVLIPITMLVAIVIFDALSMLSPFINASWPSALMSGAIALAEYAVLEQLGLDRGRKV